MKQKLLLSAFSLCLLVGVFGCGSPKPGGTGSGGTGDEQKTPGETASEPKLPAGWVKVTMPEGPCTAWFPVKPERNETDVRQQSGGEIAKLVQYFADKDGVRYLVTLTDGTPAQRRQYASASADDSLQDGLNGALGQCPPGSEVVEKTKKIKLGKYPGIEYKIRCPEGSTPRTYGRYRSYVSDTGYAVIVASSHRDDLTSADAERFFSSFAITQSATGGGAIEPKTSPKTGEWVSLFNGKDLEGWVGQAGVWQVKDGAIAATSFPSGRKENTFLCTEREFRDFELEFDAKLTGNNNSGVMIRSKLVDTAKFWTSGIKVDLGGSQAGWGGLVKYDGRNGGVLKAAGREAAKAVRADDFNHMSIRCVGKQIVVKVNDVQVQDTELSELDPSGVISFQLRHSNPTSITIKDIRLREIR